MSIQTVMPSDTPNAGRVIWNQNDLELKRLIDSFGLNIRAPEFGAVGDGVADDQPAIQKAIDQCFQNGGGSVFIPTGKYRLATKSIVLRDKVNLIGAGSQVSLLLIGDQLNQPAIVDEGWNAPNPYAFGVVRLAHFAIDGGLNQNPSTKAALATTAYFSIFEDITITNCSGHGFLVGGSGMSNFASQNRFTGCRVSKCGQSGFYFDINAVDSIVSDCFISNCRQGITINNGGMRIISNTIFGHTETALLITQTAVNCLIASNDFNFNRRGNIVITRTTSNSPQKWSQVLVTNNIILGDGLDTDGVYDAIVITSDIPAGISKVSIIGNKVFTTEGNNRFRFGVNFADNIIQSACYANVLDDCVAGAYFVAPSCSNIVFDQSAPAGG